MAWQPDMEGNVIGNLNASQLINALGAAAQAAPSGSWPNNIGANITELNQNDTTASGLNRVNANISNIAPAIAALNPYNPSGEGVRTYDMPVLDYRGMNLQGMGLVRNAIEQNAANTLTEQRLTQQQEATDLQKVNSLHNIRQDRISNSDKAIARAIDLDNSRRQNQELEIAKNKITYTDRDLGDVVARTGYDALGNPVNVDIIEKGIAPGSGKLMYNADRGWFNAIPDASGNYPADSIPISQMAKDDSTTWNEGTAMKQFTDLRKLLTTETGDKTELTPDQKAMISLEAATRFNRNSKNSQIRMINPDGDQATGTMDFVVLPKSAEGIMALPDTTVIATSSGTRGVEAGTPMTIADVVKAAKGDRAKAASLLKQMGIAQ